MAKKKVAHIVNPPMDIELKSSKARIAKKSKVAISVNESQKISSPKKKVPAMLKQPEEKALSPNLEPGPVLSYSLFTAHDIELFQAGKHFHLFELMGSHLLEIQEMDGAYFAVWAPNAILVTVIGDFNQWNRTSHKLNLRTDGSGIWEGFIPGITKSTRYKYFIESYHGARIEKGDPYAWQWELRPATASVVWDLAYQWTDQAWMKKRKKHNALNQPMAVYEVHLGSWRRDAADPEKFLSYRELAVLLPAYCVQMHFTHIELMPVMEHPFDGSWGYQQTGYFAPTSRFGTAQDFMHLVEELHRHDIGVILDWVPSHFPYDAHGLFMFDGTHLYEHADMRKGYHPDWKSYIFNSGRHEVKSFLLSNAFFWLSKFHIDGFRVDAVASMLQLNYSRKDGEWLPNEYGGTENLENVALLKELNAGVQREFPDVQMIAEESSTWPGVTHALEKNGLGFGMKWMMGWMNDTLEYFKRDPIYRSWHQDDITFSLVYAFTEKFMLPLSHDEVVHGKSPMILKMPGDEWQRFAQLRLLYTYMWTHPGTKLLFMGNEFAQTTEWNFEAGLDWHLLKYEPHRGIQKLVTELNSLYRSEPALYEYSFSDKGFEWIAADDTKNCILVFLRKGRKQRDTLIIILNFTPNSLVDYRIGIPKAGTYKEAFNSDDKAYWGSGIKNEGIHSEPVAIHGKKNSIQIPIPPFGAIILRLI